MSSTRFRASAKTSLGRNQLPVAAKVAAPTQHRQRRRREIRCWGVGFMAPSWSASGCGWSALVGSGIEADRLWVPLPECGAPSGLNPERITAPTFKLPCHNPAKPFNFQEMQIISRYDCQAENIRGERVRPVSRPLQPLHACHALLVEVRWGETERSAFDCKARGEPTN